MGILVEIQAKLPQIRPIIKKSNIVLSDCKDSHALSIDMSIIILLSLVE